MSLDFSRQCKGNSVHHDRKNVINISHPFRIRTLGVSNRGPRYVALNLESSGPMIYWGSERTYCRNEVWPTLQPPIAICTVRNLSLVMVLVVFNFTFCVSVLYPQLYYQWKVWPSYPYVFRCITGWSASACIALVMALVTSDAHVTTKSHVESNWNS